MADKLSSQRQLDNNTILLQRFFTSTEASVDTQGRVALPQKLRKHAGIVDNGSVVIVGAGKRIEIWDSDRWEAYSESLSDAAISDAAREIGLA